ncbi:C-type lectin domain family 12 member A, partial [Galemys pyrenaicus]
CDVCKGKCWLFEGLKFLIFYLFCFGVYITHNMQMGELEKLRSFKEDLVRNLSLQLTQNMNCSVKNRHLSVTLQEMATKLCRQLCLTKPEHRCKPCPYGWWWHEDRCYLLSSWSTTWEKSVKECQHLKASLLTVTNRSVLARLRAPWCPCSSDPAGLTATQTVTHKDYFPRTPVSGGARGGTPSQLQPWAHARSLLGRSSVAPAKTLALWTVLCVGTCDTLNTVFFFIPCQALFALPSMSEEVTFVDLNFQDSSKTENVKDLGKCGIKGYTSIKCRLISIPLTTPHRSSLMAPGHLDAPTLPVCSDPSHFYVSVENTDSSLPVSISAAFKPSLGASPLEGIPVLRSFLPGASSGPRRRLDGTVTRAAEHRCKPCPKGWRWHEDRCYLLSSWSTTWEKSAKECQHLKASLLTVTNRSVL